MSVTRQFVTPCKNDSYRGLCDCSTPHYYLRTVGVWEFDSENGGELLDSVNERRKFYYPNAARLFDSVEQLKKFAIKSSGAHVCDLNKVAELKPLELRRLLDSYGL